MVGAVGRGRREAGVELTKDYRDEYNGRGIVVRRGYAGEGVRTGMWRDD